MVHNCNPVTLINLVATSVATCRSLVNHADNCTVFHKTGSLGSISNTIGVAVAAALFLDSVCFFLCLACFLRLRPNIPTASRKGAA